MAVQRLGFSDLPLELRTRIHKLCVAELSDDRSSPTRAVQINDPSNGRVVDNIFGGMTEHPMYKASGLFRTELKKLFFLNRSNFVYHYDPKKKGFGGLYHFFETTGPMFTNIRFVHIKLDFASYARNSVGPVRATAVIEALAELAEILAKFGLRIGMSFESPLVSVDLVRRTLRILQDLHVSGERACCWAEMVSRDDLIKSLTAYGQILRPGHTFRNRPLSFRKQVSYLEVFMCDFRTKAYREASVRKAATENGKQRHSASARSPDREIASHMGDLRIE
ncbi:hypothetical protein K490DRAFT_56160 [Saccharata proteae CBS 121410]|uniref:Uncharacterized protein n=1 Tax=Saccharata proteae CBS 121410 TaxID=1314787 RepID=A0A9P4HYZ5_9PEZI|nr:hypothetical protein K490DRAFT_56160 [Saccharata proteae CBS 121410]